MTHVMAWGALVLLRIAAIAHADDLPSLRELAPAGTLIGASMRTSWINQTNATDEALCGRSALSVSAPRWILPLRMTTLRAYAWRQVPPSLRITNGRRALGNRVQVAGDAPAGK